MKLYQPAGRCGDCKAAGNYAADLESMHAAKRPLGIA